MRSAQMVANRAAMPTDVTCWPIATGDILTASRRFRGTADMERFSPRNDL
jgi:hypothetical protein